VYAENKLKNQTCYGMRVTELLPRLVMKSFWYLLPVFLVLAAPARATVTVTSPVAGATVSSPIQYTATAATTTCATGVASMGIYVNNTLTYVVNSTSLNTALTLSPGKYNTVVEEWDHCGGASYTSVPITVSGQTGTVTAVTVTSPAPNSTVTSPVTYAATATTATCATGIASMGIYVNNKVVYVVSGATLNTQLTLAPGAEHTVVQEWDNCGGSTFTTINLTVQGAQPAPTVNIIANPATISAGGSSTLTVTATNATTVTLTGSDGSSYNLAAGGGTETVSPASTATYTADATGASGNASAAATVTVAAAGSTSAINHVIFMLQENHTFDNYFGMLNPYRRTNGWTTGDDGNVYNVDGIDDKLTLANLQDEGVSIPLFKFKSTCIDDASSAWLESYGDVNRYNFLTTRPINNDGFVHNAEGYAKSCATSGTCSGSFTDTTGQRAMGYYDQGFLNYYYYMASQFAVSDRWFSPIASKSNPNRIATFTGGTTQGLAFDPGSDDHLGSLGLPNIFQELDAAGVSWKVYYSDTAGECGAGDDDCGSGSANYPASAIGYITYTKKYLYQNPAKAACTGTTQPSSVVGDPTNYFCIDPNHVAPVSAYFTDLTNGTLPSFAFIEPAYGITDEHPGSFQPILLGQQQMAKIINAFMASPEWKDGVFFFSYDEGGGPYDHVPPVPHHSNDKTNASLGTIPDIAGISVNPDAYNPCLPATSPATTHCDLRASSPGAHSGDAAAVNGFGAQVGFRVPNIIISPFTRRHYVSHVPMDHTAVIKFVENRFIGGGAHLTARDAAQPNLLDFFDFNNTPWATPPTPPAPASNASLGYNACTPSTM
jgi:phospholipase C